MTSAHHHEEPTMTRRTTLETAWQDLYDRAVDYVIEVPAAGHPADLADKLQELVNGRCETDYVAVLDADGTWACTTATGEVIGDGIPTLADCADGILDLVLDGVMADFYAAVQAVR